jgi:Putative peptidoglycan binding domain/D-alanyl-D-alanine carboxypeptidase
MPTQLITFTTPRFTNQVIKADIEFQESLEKIDRLATDNNLVIFVTSSARSIADPVSGAIVRPAGKSNHLIGHAIDMNILFNGNLFNSNALDRNNFNSIPQEIKNFLNKVDSDPILRWGGKFIPKDPVHIDDGLNLRDSDVWNDKFPIIQSQLITLNEAGEPRELSLTQPFMVGEDVKAVQSALKNKFDFSNLDIDGKFGTNTRDAVKAFQTSQGLRSDGIVGSLTRKKLGI